jgi:murein DD-endopeptidase MepM/ murein hydrolase activator NlpD
MRSLLATLAAPLLFTTTAFAQSPFQFPTANHFLYEPGQELKFFAPTAPEKPWTSGSFGCVRSDGWQMHEGLDILHQHTDRRGEPTDPVMATADGTIVYVSAKAALSNYGKYIVIRHVIDGLEIYSLYAHLSDIQPGVTAGKAVKAGEEIAIMGHTSNTSERITRERAHCHFELNMFVNEHFAGWYRKNFPGERNDHGIWNGQNLNGLDPREILLEERDGKFNLLNYVRSQTELCRVMVRATSFPYLTRYAPLVLKNPRADKEGVAGYEVALNYNGVAFALMPRAASEIKGGGTFQLLSVNETEYRAHPCRKLVVQHGGRWQLTDRGLRELQLLVN